VLLIFLLQLHHAVHGAGKDGRTVFHRLATSAMLPSAEMIGQIGAPGGDSSTAPATQELLARRTDRQ
jgi:hypothetical protein